MKRTDGTGQGDGKPAKGRVGRPPREEITKEQLRGIDALMRNPTTRSAAAEIKVHPRTISRWLREPAFGAEYDSRVKELQLELQNAMFAARDEVWDRFLHLTRSEDLRVSLTAATSLLKMLLARPVVHAPVRDEGDGAHLDAVPAALVAFLRDADPTASHAEGRTT